MQKKATTKTKKSGRSTTAASKRNATTATREAQAPLSGNGNHDAASGRATSATTRAAATARKRAASAPAKKRTATRAANHNGHGIATDQIALRAYYLAEHRQQRGLPGDPNTDWLEAEAQLRAEAGTMAGPGVP